MDIPALVSEIADLKFENGYVFENGAPFYETLGPERAEGLLKALQAHGYRIVRDFHPHVGSPSIVKMEEEDNRETTK